LAEIPCRISVRSNALVDLPHLDTFQVGARRGQRTEERRGRRAAAHRDPRDASPLDRVAGHVGKPHRSVAGRVGADPDIVVARIHFHSESIVRNVKGDRTVRAVNEGDHRAALERRGVRVGLLAYLIWGFLTIYWKQLDAFRAIELIAWRMVGAAVVMAVIVTVRRTWPTIVAALTDAGTVRRLIVAALLLTANWGSYVWAVTNDRVIETALGYFMAPLATMSIGVLVLHERPTSAQRFAFVCATVAVVVLTVSYGRPPWIALALAATWSLYGLSKRRIHLGAIESLAGETFILIAPAVAALIVFSTQPDSVVESASTRQWVFVLGTGVITAVPLMLFAFAAKTIPFTLLGPLNLVVPIINFVLGWAVYDEPVPLDRLIGFTFVWIALLAVIWDTIRRARNPRIPGAVPARS
jgi:chloramphenicol-sensitive protein RarD